MKKYRLLMLFLLATITIGLFVIVPAVREAGAAGAPQLVSKTPADGTVILDVWDGVVTITYDTPVRFGSGCIRLYYRIKNNDYVNWCEQVGVGDSEYFSISSDGRTVTIDFGWNFNDLFGDPYNTYNENYKVRYWVQVDGGAIVSRDDPPVDAAYWGDRNWNIYVQSTPPQIESRYPADGQTRVIAKAGTEFSVTFDENVYKVQGVAPVIYAYDDTNPSGSWDNELAVVCNDTRVTGNVLKFSLPQDLKVNTIYGIMIPGPRNITGLKNIFLIDNYLTPFPGQDYPLIYWELPLEGFCCFTTAQKYYAPYLEKKTPPSGAVEVSPDGDIVMEFDHVVEANTGSNKYVCIKKYSDDSVVKQILNTNLLPAGEGRRALTIKNPGLSMNTKYYITIDSGAFISADNDLPYEGISDKSWFFTTTLETYTLTYAAGAHGKLTGDTSQQVKHGSNGTAVTAVPDTGYHFVQWSDGVTTAERTDTNVTGDLSVTAEFTINVYTLTYKAGTYGKLTGVTSQQVEHGSDGTPVKAEPDPGYHFVKWSDGVKTAERTDTNITGDIRVAAEFAINVYTLTYAAGAHGKLAGVTSQQVEHGGSGTPVTAVPDTGYHFVKWSDGVTTAERTDTNVTGDLSVTAEFAINVYTLTYAAGAHGKLTGVTSQQVEHGSSGTAVTAVPDTGYHFVQWSDGVTTAERKDTNVTGDLSVTAEFAINVYTLTYKAGTHGKLNGNTSQQVEHGSGGDPVTAVPDPGYHFVKWSDGVTAAERTDANVTKDISVTAVFAINVYTLTYTAGAHGKLTGDALQKVEYGGSGTPVTAVPEPGYHFVQWSDGATVAERTDTGVKENLSVTALFQINSYTVKFVDHDGTVLKTENVNYKASATAPKDPPSRKGYSFAGWDKDYRSVTSDITVTAQYTINRYRVTFFDYDGSTIDIQYVPYGGNASAPDDPERKGYDFSGWDRDFSNVFSAISVTAQYEKKTFTVIFKNYDGSVLKTEVVEYGKKPTPPEVDQREGYVFTGWDSEFTGVTGDMVIMALYSPKEDREEKKDSEYEKGFSWLWLWILIAVVVVAIIAAYTKRRREYRGR